MMNDSGYLGPAQGILATEQLRAQLAAAEAAGLLLLDQLAAALKRAEEAEAEMDRLYTDLRKARWQGIRCAFDFADYQDEQEGRCGCLTGQAG